MANFRVDVGELRPASKLGNGWLRADAYLARTGVQLYVQPDGTKRREYRPPEEVFKADSLESFEMVPVTDEHPEDRYLTAANTAGLQKGNVGSSVVRDGKFVKANILVTDAALVEAVVSKKKAQVSCGYVCDLEPAAKGAVTADGEPYDFIQRNIRGNHVALLQTGRAGPDVRVHLDAEDAWQLPDETSEKTQRNQPRNDEGHTVKKLINGVTYDVPDQAAEAMAHEEKLRADGADKVAKDLAALTERVSKAEGELTATKAKLDEEKKRADGATSPEKVAEMVQARGALMAQATEILGKDEAAKLLKADEKDVRVAMATKLIPGFKADGKDATYVQVALETALALAKADSTRRFANTVNDAQPLATTDAGYSAADARKKMIAENRLIHGKAQESHTTQ